MKVNSGDIAGRDYGLRKSILKGYSDVGVGRYC